MPKTTTTKTANASTKTPKSDHAAAWALLTAWAATPPKDRTTDGLMDAIVTLAASGPRDTVGLTAGEFGSIPMPAARALRIMLGDSVKGITRASVVKAAKG